MSNNGNSIEILRGDARALAVPSESIQCCVTSPPYWGLRKYAGEQELDWNGWRVLMLIGAGIAIGAVIDYSTRTNAPVLTSDDLQTMYHQYNEDYWHDGLSHTVKAVFDESLPDEFYGQYQPLTRRIVINDAYAAHTKIVQWTLLHEMAHLSVRTQERRAQQTAPPPPPQLVGDGTFIVFTPVDDSHGEAWQQEMRRLMMLGAFDKVW